MLYFVVESVFAFCHMFHEFSALHTSGNIAIQITSRIAFYQVSLESALSVGKGFLVWYICCISNIISRYQWYFIQVLVISVVFIWVFVVLGEDWLNQRLSGNFQKCNSYESYFFLVSCFINYHPSILVVFHSSTSDISSFHMSLCSVSLL